VFLFFIHFFALHSLAPFCKPLILKFIGGLQTLRYGLKITNFEEPTIFLMNILNSENSKIAVQSFEIAVQSFEIGVQNLEIGVQNLEIGVQNLEIAVQSFEIGVQNLEIGVQNLEIAVQNLEIAVQNLEIGVQNATRQKLWSFENTNNGTGFIF
jgi:exonuclease VII small subunit